MPAGPERPARGGTGPGRAGPGATLPSCPSRSTSRRCWRSAGPQGSRRSASPPPPRSSGPVTPWSSARRPACTTAWPSPTATRTGPRRRRGLVAGAQAIVVGARRYAPRAVEPVDAGGGRPQGRVARYARADHYAPLRAALWTVAHHLRRHGWRAVVFADDNALVDREAAYLAGLGWFGKNANLLLPGQGSWFVLGLGRHRRAARRRSPAAGRRLRRRAGAASTAARRARSSPTVWSTRRAAWRGWCSGPASSRASTARRWATGSTAATSARRSARPTAARTGGRRPTQAGRLTPSCRRRLGRPARPAGGRRRRRCSPATGVGTSPTGSRGGCAATPSWPSATSATATTPRWSRPSPGYLARA